MVFIVKIPGRSRRTSPEDRGENGPVEAEMHHEPRQQAEVTESPTSSTSAEVGVEDPDDEITKPSVPLPSETSSVSSATTPPLRGLPPIGQPAPAVTSFAHTRPSTSIQDALDALSMLSIGSPSPQPDGQEGQSSLANKVYPVLPTVEVQESQTDPQLDASAPEASVAPTPPVSSHADLASPPLPPPPLLDIIVAPAVLAHRYVRGRDASLIVERPERIRAVLLGVAALLGRMAEISGSMASPVSAARHSDVRGKDGDDLIAQLENLNVGAQREELAVTSLPVQVLLSTRSASLHPAHPALAAVHSHEEDMIEAILPECEQKRRDKPKVSGQASSHAGQRYDEAPTHTTLYSSYVSQLCSYAPHAPPVKAQLPPRARQVSSATATPTSLGRTRRSARQASPGPASASSTPSQRPKAEVPSSNGSPSASILAHVAGAQALDQDVKPPDTPIDEKGDGVLSALPPASARDDYDEHAGRQKSSSSSSSEEEEEGDLHPSEIPHHLSQGDLYLRGSRRRSTEHALAGYGSAEAMQHALAASIEAIDRVCSSSTHQRLQTTLPSNAQLGGSITSLSLKPPDNIDSSASAASAPSRRAFVLTRPPGHHCSGSAPSGFCWVNNAAVAAMHAYQAYGVDRVVIFDIDLHHGNGTQKIAWRINEETRRGDLARAAKIKATAPSLGGKSGSGRGRGGRKSGGTGGPTAGAAVEASIPPRGLQIFYSSLHDIESFPCEDGDADLVRDASVCIKGAHGQWIWNVHLDKYDSPSSFDALYRTKYSQLFAQARNFLSSSAAEASKTLVLISCGFDACSYELQGMQRHGKHVPPGFYEVFAKDAVRLSEELAGGKVVSLLEGGYGDRALCSASIAHLKGLATPTMANSSPEGQQEGCVPRPPMLGPYAASTSTNIARHYSSFGSALDPYAHQWFSLEALKALEKAMASILRTRSLARAKESSSQMTASGMLTPTIGASPVRRRGGGGSTQGATGRPATGPGGAGVHDWLALASRYFTAFEELCEPLTLPPLPSLGAGKR